MLTRNSILQVDFCANNPCPEGHRCNDRGNDFTCECPGGRNGPDCNQVPRTVSLVYLQIQMFDSN